MVSASELARRADKLIAETRAVLRRYPHRPAVAGRPANLGHSPDWVAAARARGREYAHDPYRFAASLGIAVRHVPLGELQNPQRPRTLITGRAWRLKEQPLIQIAEGLDAYEDRRVLCHELAHLAGIEDEGGCDRFARAFMAVADDETPGGKWRLIQAGLLARARQAARR